ncbi:MAG TPA: DUF354 domain-containing protein [Acidimicrobiia bacterium]|nr:DUF354 domain-containing protein [Acidimicrobiia bacterium]
MKILVDVLHPAHVHFFRHFITDVESQGHDVRVTARDKEMTLELLDRLGIPARVLSSRRSGVIGLGSELVTRTARLIREARRSRPDVMVGIMGPSIAPAGRLLRIPSVVFYDTENAGRTNRWVYPMASAVCTPDCYQGPVRGRHHTYAGYHELAYLHPNRFTPDPTVPARAGIDSGEPYGIVRFVSWQASHDLGEAGLTLPQKREIVRAVARHGRVVISSEAPLPDDLESLRVPAELVPSIHHLLAGARAIVGESATMTSEAAVLGVPAVYLAGRRLGYTDEQENRYGLVRTIRPGDLEEALDAVDRAMTMAEADRGTRRSSLLADKIDTTRWVVDFVTNRRWEA